MTNDVSKSRPSRLRRGLVAASLVTGGFILGVASLAVAAPEGAPWAGGFHRHGPPIGMIQHVLRGALDNVGATTAQEDKIHDIIATTFTQMEADAPQRDAQRKQVLDLLKAPTIDRAAVEKLRAEKVAEFDAKSKTIANALVEAAGQLSPEQRVKLVQNAEDRMEHGGWGGWRHGDRMDEHGGHDAGDHG